MTRRSAVVLGLLGLVLAEGPKVFSATLTPTNDPVAGRALAKKLRSAPPTENSVITGILRIETKKDRLELVPLLCRIVTNETSWQTIYETHPTNGAPAEQLVIIHSPSQTNLYVHTLGTNAARSLVPAQANISFAGSDFWLTDLGLDFLHWPGQRLLKVEMRRSRWCDVLESIPAPGATNGYARVVAWLDKETGGPIHVEAFDHTNKRIKDFRLGSFKKLEGVWHLRNMEIESRKTGSKTRIEFDLTVKEERRID